MNHQTEQKRFALGDPPEREEQEAWADRLREAGIEPPRRHRVTTDDRFSPVRPRSLLRRLIRRLLNRRA